MTSKMNLIERIQAAYTALTSKTFVMFAKYNDEVGYCHHVGEHNDVMDVLKCGNQYMVENENGWK